MRQLVNSNNIQKAIPRDIPSGAFLFGTLLIVFFLLGIQSHAQSKIQVNDEAGDPLPGAHVTFQAIDGDAESVVLTNTNGEAVIPESFRASERLILKVNYLGYAEFLDTADLSRPLEVKMKQDEVVLNQLVVTGLYAPDSPEKSIHKIKIIDRKQMDSRGVVNLNDALKFETNLRIGQDNVLGSSATVQGISGENVKIMIDGVPVIGRQDGNIDLNQINLNSIERIEIVEGPLSVKYGTNALAGTINLITKKDQKKTYNTKLNLYYESVGQYNVDANVGWQKGNHQISVGGGRNYFDGWTPGEDFTLLPKSRIADSNRVLQWNPKEQFFFNGQYIYRKKEFSTRIFGDYFNEVIVNRGVPRQPYEETAFDEYYTTNRYNIGLNLSEELGEGYHYDVLASYNYYSRSKETYFKDLTNLNEILSPNPSDHDTTLFQTLMSRGSVVQFKRDKKLNWELGYDVLYEQATGKRIEENVQTMGDYAVFGSLEWRPLDQWTFKPALRYAYNTNYTAPLIPSLNIKYARGDWNVRGSYARGFRAPSLKELYFEFVDVNHNIVGNQDLKAENSNNVQFDVGRKWIKGQRMANVGFGLFYNDIQDMITLATLDGGTEFTYINVGTYQTHGLDINANHAVNHWKFSLGFVYTGRSNQINDSIAYEGFSYSPEVRALVLYEFKKLKGNVSFNYKYNGEVPGFAQDENENIVETRIEAYQMIDLAATKYLWKNQVQWVFGVKNLLDVQNINMNSVSGGIHNSGSGSAPVAWGRTFFTSIKFNVDWK